MKRSGTPLTDNEKLMIINVYNYFLGANSEKEDHQKTTLRKQVAEVLGVAEGTVGSVVSDWKSRGDNTFTPHKPLGRRVESIPTSSAKKQEIIDWLNAHDIAFSNELRKPELLELVRMNKENVPFSCVKIAEQYEHEVNFTPLTIANCNLLKVFGQL